MYKKIALISGMFISGFLYFNGYMGEKVGLLMSTFIFHFIALIVLIIFEIIRHRNISLKVKFPLEYYLPGILSVGIVAINSLTIQNIGLSLVIGISMFGQLIFSNIIDHYGLMGMPVKKLGKNKMFGIIIIILGIFLMVNF